LPEGGASVTVFRENYSEINYDINGKAVPLQATGAQRVPGS